METERWARRHIAPQVQSTGAAGHHAPEDRPDAIGRATAPLAGRHRR